MRRQASPNDKTQCPQENRRVFPSLLQCHKGLVCNECEHVEPDFRGGGCHQCGVVGRNERADQRAAATAAGPKAARAEETAGAEETGRGAKAAAEAATRPAGAAADAAATASATAAGAAAADATASATAAAATA